MGEIVQAIQEHRVLSAAAALTLAVGLTACGGGSSDSDNQKKHIKASSVSVEERLTAQFITPYLDESDSDGVNDCFANSPEATMFHPHTEPDKYGVTVRHKLKGNILNIIGTQTKRKAAFQPGKLKFGGFGDPDPASRLYAADDHTRDVLYKMDCTL